MLRYAAIFVFGILFVVACVGWGGLVAAVLARGERPDAAERAAFGLSFLVALGGVLNLLGVVRPIVLAVLLATGLILAVLTRRGGAPRAPLPASAAVVAVVAAFVLVRYLSSLSSTTFNPDDDFRAYFVFPTKLIETGSLGADPFSGRRCLAALGGGYFLDAFVLAFFDHQSLNLMDKGVGLLLFIASLASFARSRSLAPRVAGLPLLVAAVVPPLQVNVTPLLICAALFLALFRRLADAPASAVTPTGGFLLALLATALCSFKSSMIPLAGVLLGAYFIELFLEGERAPALRGALLTAVATLLLLAPWMISMHASAGTPLYPVFGRGNNHLPPLPFPEPWALARILAAAAPFALLLLAVVAAERKSPLATTSLRRAVIALLAAASVGSIAVGLGTTGMGFTRHSFALFLASLLVTLVLVLERAGAETETPRRALAGAVAALIVTVLAAGAVVRRQAYLNWLGNVAFGISGRPLDDDERRAAARSLQESVPPGETLLAYLPRPYLLDFRRNPVFIADVAGSWSPPPGMPLASGPEAVRDYLLGLSIRYLAFAETSTTAKTLEALGPGERYVWTVASLVRQLEFERNVVALARVYRRIHDAGDTYVIDLGERWSDVP